MGAWFTSEGHCVGSYFSMRSESCPWFLLFLLQRGADVALGQSVLLPQNKSNCSDPLEVLCPDQKTPSLQAFVVKTNEGVDCLTVAALVGVCECKQMNIKL